MTVVVGGGPLSSDEDDGLLARVREREVVEEIVEVWRMRVFIGEMRVASGGVEEVWRDESG